MQLLLFQYKSIDVSKDLIVYGTEKNTGALFIYKRNPYAFFRALPGGSGIKGPITNIKISNNQQFIAYSNQFGDLAVHSINSLLSKTLVTKLEAPCASIYWHFSDKEFYCGDDDGNVSVVNLNFFLGRSLISIQVNRILELEDPIVQIDGFNDFLLISSTTKTILCNNEREEFKQLGNRPREGSFGSCFVIDFEALENHENKLAAIDEETYESMLMKNVIIYCSRPGMRLWEINLNGNILKTHQYKNANFSAQQIHLLMSNNKTPSADSSPLMVDKTNQFQIAYSLLNRFVFTWNECGFYIISPKESKIIFWSNEFDGAISNAKIFGSSIYLYLKDGRLFEICFYKLQNYALHLCHTHFYAQAGDLIKNNLDFFLSLLRNNRNMTDMNKYRIFLKIRDHLVANERTETLKSLTEVFDELTNKKIQNVMILSKNLFNKPQQQYQNEVVENIEQREEDCDEEEEGEDVEETPQMLPISKQYDEDSISSITSAEIDRACKQLYIIHQTSLISNLNSRERLCKIFDKFKSAQITRILDELEKLFVENEEYNEDESKTVVCKMFLDYLQPEIIFEIDDEKTLNFIANALLHVQTNGTDVSRCRRCEFPLNCGSSSTGYEEIGNILQQCYWSRLKYEKCFELCRSIPHLLKITGKFLTDERKYEKIITYAINLGDLEILHKSLEIFNDISLFHQLLDDYLMAVNHGKFKCLKCDEINEVKQVYKILTWDCIFQAIEYYLSGHELIDLLMHYSKFIPKGALSRQFYMKLLLHACD